ncbi:hypothetical protein V6N13_109492 [Hibiscus sabdariffa]|uniref:Uncharacterized protein n=2 Tax=Hibiscus sabdariffa TaxID=183260 RepID=A0ABR1Z9S7_9ROSI
MMREHFSQTEAIVQGHSSSIRILEAQLRKLTTSMNSRQLETLHSNTESQTIKGKEHCKVITLRSDEMEVGVEDLIPTVITQLPSILQSKSSMLF